MAELTGQTFAGCEIISELGRGGMGAVYKARQSALNRLVAVKVMSPQLAEDADYITRFKREAAVAAQLHHQNMVLVHSAGEEKGLCYIVMEFVEGRSLQDHIEHHGRLAPLEALAITVHIAQALQYAWNKSKLIHRDIKPANIFLSDEGEVKVGDLGLAKNVGQSTAGLTQTGMAMGSPHYIAPEQARGIKEIDFRSDIYSLGCTLYHMLTGQPPYTGTDAMSIMHKHIFDPPPAIFKTLPTCPMPLGMLVGKMLSKQPNARPQSYEDLIADLHAVAEKIEAASVQATAALPQAAATATVPLKPQPQPMAVTPTLTLPVAVKKKSSAMIYGIAGAVTAVLVGGLLWWSPWKKSSSQDSDAPSLQQSAAAYAALKQLGNVFTNSVGAEMVYIPPGEFMLGSTKEEQDWAVATNRVKEDDVGREGETPRKATIKQGFWLGRTEVTVGQWKQFVKETHYVTDAEKKGESVVYDQGRNGRRAKGANWRDAGFGFPLQDNHPICCVSWNDAVAFCEWLTDRERKAGRLPACQVVRLPTEAEWEYACRARTQTKFWWGENMEDGVDRLNWWGKEDGFESVAPVDSYGERGRNGFGLADMQGNMREFCLDEFDPVGTHEELYTGNQSRHVIRGASFASNLVCSRSAFRGNVGTSESSGCLGFRVVVGLEAGATASSSPAAASRGMNDAFLSEVAALPAEQQVARVVAKLKELNPGYDGKETHKIEDGEVTTLYLLQDNCIADISPLRALKSLRRLNLADDDASAGSQLADLSPIKGMKLTYLRIVSSSIKDLSPLRGMPLDSLCCVGIEVADLSPLKGMPLKFLTLISNRKLEDLSPLAGMALRRLTVYSTRIKDLSPLRGMSLTHLEIHRTNVSDLSLLRHMPLQSLRCDFVPGRDTAILRSIKTLKTINNLPAAEFWKQVEAGKMPTVSASKDETEKLTDNISLANPKAGESRRLDLGGGVTLELVGIPPGEFLLGSTKEEQAWAVANGARERDVKREGEAPRRTRIKEGFWLGRTEVTVGQWKQFVKETGYQSQAEQAGQAWCYDAAIKGHTNMVGKSWLDPNFGAAPEDNHPVSCVSWNDAVAFCGWLTERERKGGRLPAGQVVRLPTEAEWEYACRAGAQTKFWWGESKEDGKGRLNWAGKDDGFGVVAPVDYFGQQGRNGFGLADMLGNVYEWCLDEYDAKQAHEECYQGNPGARVLRGGTFTHPPAFCRCAFGYSYSPAYSFSYYGFRVAIGGVR